MSQMPLSSGARLTRGFRRVGALLSLLIFSIGVVTGAFIGYGDYSRASAPSFMDQFVIVFLICASAGAVIAALAYGLCVALGWTLAGFARD